MRLPNKKIILGLCGIILATSGFFWLSQISSAAQLYCSPETVASAQVPSAQSNFTALVKPTDNRFKTTGNGGHVANANGYDIRPYTDATCATPITTYELVPGTYNASTGTFEMWVKFTSIDVASVVYLGYGDTGISTDGSSGTAWDASFGGVWHLPDGTSLTTLDSTSNNNDGTPTNVAATSGQIDGAGSYTIAGTSNIDAGTGASTIGTTDYTLSAWVYPTANTEGYVLYKAGSSGAYYLLVVNANRTLKFQPGSGAQGSHDSTGVLPINTWSYVTLTYDLPNYVFYINGVADTSGTDTSPGGFVTGSGVMLVGYYIDASLDELHMATNARSADWIQTEFNNQSAPNTFFTLGTEVPLGGGGGGGVTSTATSTQVLINGQSIINGQVLIP